MRESCAWHGSQQNGSSLSPVYILSACRLKLFTHDNVGSDCTLHKLLSQLCRRCCWPGKSLNIPGREKRGQCVSVRYVAHAHARFNFCRETSPTLAAGRKEGRKEAFLSPPHSAAAGMAGPVLPWRRRRRHPQGDMPVYLHRIQHQLCSGQCSLHKFVSEILLVFSAEQWLAMCKSISCFNNTKLLK